jgi:formiminoglutamate deiminase
MTDYYADDVWLPDGLASRVRLSVADGRFSAIEAGVDPQVGDARLPGVVLPGFANAHSHAFHRALRGRTHDSGGTFWTWREQMYAIAATLTPDSYFELARAVFAEMALSGVTCVGEFHYVHHQPDGSPYDDPNAMGEAVIVAARAAGIRITLLDTCYLAGGLTLQGPSPLGPEQIRFSDGDATSWAERVAKLADRDGVRIGAAIHSVRAVPRDQLPIMVTAAAGKPLHLHLSEQPAENEQCLAAYGVTPTELLAEVGALGSLTSAVHATHLTDNDIRLLGATHTTSCFCPTTERDLADGIGPARALHDAGSPLSLGSDQHAVIDLIEETRALEMHERLASRQRGRFTLPQLVAAVTANGHRSLGWDDSGQIEVGARADLVAIRRDSVRTAGSLPGQIMLSATASDIDTVLADGTVVVRAGQHTLGDVSDLYRFN